MADNFTIVTPDGNRSIKSREDGSDHVQAVDVAGVPGGLLTPSDAMGNPAGIVQTAGFGMAWDGSQWVRNPGQSGWRGVALANDTRSAGVTSPTFFAPAGSLRGLVVCLHVGAAYDPGVKVGITVTGSYNPISINGGLPPVSTVTAESSLVFVLWTLDDLGGLPAFTKKIAPPPLAFRVSTTHDGAAGDATYSANYRFW